MHLQSPMLGMQDDVDEVDVASDLQAIEAASEHMKAMKRLLEEGCHQRHRYQRHPRHDRQQVARRRHHHNNSNVNHASPREQ